MLTGPVTMLQWSFVRDDVPRALVCRHIALAIRDEVADLEAAGIGVIQVDEPAFREGLPLRHSDWTVACFRRSTSSIRDDTSIHTHMCYWSSTISCRPLPPWMRMQFRSRRRAAEWNFWTPSCRARREPQLATQPRLVQVVGYPQPPCSGHAGDGGASWSGPAAPGGLADLG